MRDEEQFREKVETFGALKVYRVVTAYRPAGPDGPGFCSDEVVGLGVDLTRAEGVKTPRNRRSDALQSARRWRLDLRDSVCATTSGH